MDGSGLLKRRLRSCEEIMKIIFFCWKFNEIHLEIKIICRILFNFRCIQKNWISFQFECLESAKIESSTWNDLWHLCSSLCAITAIAASFMKMKRSSSTTASYEYFKYKNCHMRLTKKMITRTTTTTMMTTMLLTEALKQMRNNNLCLIKILKCLHFYAVWLFPSIS
jgi:hypothetical protein